MAGTDLTQDELNQKVLVMMLNLKTPKEIVRELGINTDQLKRSIRQNFKHAAEEFQSAMEQEAVAPEGWEGTVKKMKKHPEIDNPWALAWDMKNKGMTPHNAASSFLTPGAKTLLNLIRDKGRVSLRKILRQQFHGWDPESLNVEVQQLADMGVVTVSGDVLTLKQASASTVVGRFLGDR